MQIGLKERRRMAGLTLDDVGEKLGISGSQYSRYEANPARFRQEHLAALMKLFDCTLEELLGTASQSTDLLASVRRTIPVFALNSNWGDEEMLNMVGEYAPTNSVTVDAYGVEATDSALAHEGNARAILLGDWCVVEPSLSPMAGDIVHYVDPKTGDGILRVFVPLHPSNPRAPGFLLKCNDPDIDDMYVPQKQARNIKGVVIERRVLLRKLP